MVGGSEAEQGRLRVQRAQGPPCHKSCSSALGGKGQTPGQPMCVVGGGAGGAPGPAAFPGRGGQSDSQSQPAAESSFLKWEPSFPRSAPWLIHP